LSGRLPAEPRRALVPLMIALTGVVVAYVLFLPGIFDAFLPWPLWMRAVMAFVLCAPLGGLLGMFFPYGIRLTTRVNPDFTCWAWAINGCFTVAGSVASIMVAMTFGFSVVILVG